MSNYEDGLFTLVCSALRGAPGSLQSGLALAGVSEGEPNAIPGSPWAWVEVGPFTVRQDAGSDKESTTHTFLAKVLWSFSADAQQAEHGILQTIGPLRQVFRTSMKMGDPNVARSHVIGGVPGWVLVNGVVHRYVDLSIEVTYKEAVTYNV